MSVFSCQAYLLPIQASVVAVEVLYGRIIASNEEALKGASVRFLVFKILNIIGIVLKPETDEISMKISRPEKDLI